MALVPAAALALARPDTRAGRASLPLALAVGLQLVPALPFGLADDQWGDPVLPVLVGGSPVLAVALLLVPAAALLLYALRFPQPLPLGPPRTVTGAAAWVLAPALLWTALDLLRATFEPGGFWGPLLHSQAGAPGARLAALGGPWLVTFALVEPGGRYAADAGLEVRRTVVVADVATAGPPTPYRRIGDALGWAAVAGAGGLLLAGGALRRRASGG